MAKGTSGSIAGVKITEDNTKEILDFVQKATTRALTVIGMNAEKHAKALCPVGTAQSTGKKGYRGGTLRNSITFDVNPDEKTVTIGSNVEYAPYVELGTGPHFQAPPNWEDFSSSSGSGGGHGYVKPRPYLKPAVQDHINEYIDIIKSELS